MKRAVVLVLDGVGIGELPDADQYGDIGSNTLGNVARATGGLTLPVLEELGLGNISAIKGVNTVEKPRACFGKMAEQSAGKDSTSGHWELFGIIVKKPFPTYPNGFPPHIIKSFESRIKHEIIGNIPASGTEIIKRLGEEHIRTKKPIVYTSADSVFQIACHIDTFSLEELYRYCEIARALLQGEHAVARVIARPFAGTAPSFYRTKDRRDFSLCPPESTLLDYAKDAGYDVVVIGKIDDLVGHRGYTQAYHSVNNLECLELVLKMLHTIPEGLVVANFVQFDMDWGHRNDIDGFKKGLIEIDEGLGKVASILKKEDILIITADHGNDPTTPSTDHSREYVPLLAYSPGCVGRNLGIRKSFADVAKTIACHFNINGIKHGEDFCDCFTA